MEFYVDAFEVYEAHKYYEDRIARGKFDTRIPRPLRERFPFLLTLEASLGDFMIRVGLRLKKHAFAGKTILWSPVTGSKA